MREALHLSGHEDHHKDGSYATVDNTQQAHKCVVTCEACLVKPHHLCDASTLLLLLLCCSPDWLTKSSYLPQQTNSISTDTHTAMFPSITEFPSTTESSNTTEPPNTTASPNTTEYVFYIVHFGSSGPAAASYLNQQRSEYGDLVVVPYFPVPPYGEKFNDTEGRFPMLEQLQQDLRNNYFGDNSILWFAQVLPGKEEGGKTAYLAVDIDREGLRLVRVEPSYVARYVGTRVDTED
jgi:hypothetical protein